jgi:hypothetical protein
MLVANAEIATETSTLHGATIAICIMLLFAIQRDLVILNLALVLR